MGENGTWQGGGCAVSGLWHGWCVQGADREGVARHLAERLQVLGHEGLGAVLVQGEESLVQASVVLPA